MKLVKRVENASQGSLVPQIPLQHRDWLNCLRCGLGNGHTFQADPPNLDRPCLVH